MRLSLVVQAFIILLVPYDPAGLANPHPPGVSEAEMRLDVVSKPVTHLKENKGLTLG